VLCYPLVPGEHDTTLPPHPNRKAIAVGLEESTMMGYGITSNRFGQPKETPKR
jgi:hypothetical protein